MFEELQSEFDFPSFAFSLTNLPSKMLYEVEEKIKEVSKLSLDDPTLQRDYLSKLQRLQSFLRTGEFPAEMTPEEREGYELLCGFSVWMD